MKLVLPAGFLVASFAVTWLILPWIMGMLKQAGFVRPNFRGEEIPLGVGIVFFLTTLTVITVGLAIGLLQINGYVFLSAAGAICLFGLVDDIFGSRHATGLKGHFKKLIFERELTTGALKAIAGGMTAILVSLKTGQGTGVYGWLLLFLNALIIALATNAVNLLDLRPGRAAKGFILGVVFITAAGVLNEHLIYLAIILGSLLAYLPTDLTARGMMGDTGSNVLGLTLGFIAIFTLSTPVKVGLLIFLLGFHVFTEKYSLTKIIEKNRFLTYIDMIGRKHK